MHALFEELQESKDEAKLLNLIITGQIKTSDADKQGQTPLMFAAQYDFSEKTISALIELGSDIDA